MHRNSIELENDKEYNVSLRSGNNHREIKLYRLRREIEIDRERDREREIGRDRERERER